MAKALSDTTRNGGEWPIPFESLIMTAQVTFAATESLRTGQPVSVGQP